MKKQSTQNIKLDKDSLLRFVPADQSLKVWESAINVPNVNEYGREKLSTAEASLRLIESRLPHYERTILDGNNYVENLQSLFRKHNSSVIRLAPKDVKEDDRISIWGDHYMGIKTIDEFYEALLSELDLHSEEELNEKVRDYFIIEREVPGTVNIHALTMMNVGDQLFIEMANELEYLAEGSPNYSLTTNLYDYQQLLEGKIEIKDFLKACKIYAHGNNPKSISEENVNFVLGVLKVLVEKKLPLKNKYLEAATNTPHSDVNYSLGESIYFEAYDPA